MLSYHIAKPFFFQHSLILDRTYEQIESKEVISECDSELCLSEPKISLDPQHNNHANHLETFFPKF
jgi:hypothetical protein